MRERRCCSLAKWVRRRRWLSTERWVAAIDVPTFTDPQSPKRGAMEALGQAFAHAIPRNFSGGPAQMSVGDINAAWQKRWEGEFKAWSMGGERLRNDTASARHLKDLLLDEGGCPLEGLKALRRQGWECGTATFNVCLAALCRQNRVDEADKLYIRMCEGRSVKPSLVSARILMWAHALHGDSNRCQDIFSDLSRQNIVMPRPCCEALLVSMAKKGIDFLPYLHSLMTRDLVGEVAVKRAISLSTNFAHAEAAFHLLDNQFGAASSGSFSVLLQCARRQGKVEAAEDIHRRMVSRRLVKIQDWTVLLCVYMDKGDLRGAEVVLERMRGWGKLDARVYTVMVKVCVEFCGREDVDQKEKEGAISRAEELFEEAVDAGHVPSCAHLCTALMEVYAATGEAQRAEDLHWRLHREYEITRLSKPLLVAYERAVAGNAGSSTLRGPRHRANEVKV
eukprot:Hpha_TRINITY_DN22917_c0_g1::TRINITY_DN22917_c0_g1_i1::g.153987::m.153987